MLYQLKKQVWVNMKVFRRLSQSFIILTCLLLFHVSPVLAKVEIPETVHDFGKINYDQKVEHLFRIVNKGEKELIIEKLKSSCGCTAALISEKNIKSGEVGIVRVVYDAHKGLVGEFVKTVSVFIEGEKDPITFSIKGEAKRKFDPETSPNIFIAPQKVDLGVINLGEEKKFNLLIENRGKGDLYIKNFKVGREGDGTPLNQKAIKPGKKIQATFSYVSKKHGIIDDSFTIVSNDPVSPITFINIKGKVKER